MYCFNCRINQIIRAYYIDFFQRVLMQGQEALANRSKLEGERGITTYKPRSIGCVESSVGYKFLEWYNCTILDISVLLSFLLALAELPTVRYKKYFPVIIL